jgi:hypothetical protein
MASAATSAWQDRAACAGRHELFDACVRDDDAPPLANQSAIRRAKALCYICEVRRECLGEAMATGQLGVWAGTTPNQRTRKGGKPHKRRAAS